MGFMSEKVNWPLTVLITQGLLTLFALVWLLVIVLGVSSIPRRLEAGASIFRLLLVFGTLSSIIALFAFTVWSLAKRKVYARWLALISLTLLWAVAAYVQLRPPQGPIKPYQFNSPAERFGGLIGQALIQISFIVLIFRFAFAKRIKEFLQNP